MKHAGLFFALALATYAAESVTVQILDQEEMPDGIYVTVSCDGADAGAAIVAIMREDGEDVFVDEQPVLPGYSEVVVWFPYHQVGNCVAYRGPAGEVPPDTREPSDPPPPPETGGPTTGGGDDGGPTTGGGDLGGPPTGGGGSSGGSGSGSGGGSGVGT